MIAEWYTLEPMDPEQQPQQMSPLQQWSNPRGLIVFIIAVFILSGATVAGVIVSSDDNNNPSETASTQPSVSEDTIGTFESVAPNTLTYGYWETKQAIVKTFDLSTGKERVLAKLPVKIKKISATSDDELVFINNTNVRDHGDEIARYTVSSKKYSPFITASDGFGIDDYVLSPDKEFIAYWEVQVDQVSGVLSGGRSRVFKAAVDNPSQKTLLYDEAASETIPVHYPRAVLNDGTVFLDTFLPNSGAGWAYGMSVVKADGSKQDIQGMTNGAYSSQPTLSPDGKYLVFAGYDQSLGSGATIKNGFRQAMLTPNTVEVLDTATLVRSRLTNLSSEDRYISVEWDTESSSLLYSALSKTVNRSGVFTYNLALQSTKKFTTNDTLVKPITDSVFLIGSPIISESTLGNLGSSYAHQFSSFSVYRKEENRIRKLPLSDSRMQFIDITPFSEFVAYAEEEDTGDNRDNLQLQTLPLQFPSLEPERNRQQTDPKNPSLPKCRDLTTAQCNDLLGTSYSPPKNYRADPSWDAAFIDCFNQQKSKNKAGPASSAVCSDSPLYLYGTTGQKVQVKIHTPIYNAQPSSEKNIYDVVLKQNGMFSIGKDTYENISYDFIPALGKIDTPTFGKIVEKNDVGATLVWYAKNLGLNDKETDDIVSYAKEVVTTTYAFISFFDHKTSHALLPLTFTPQPKTYVNIVFYFKLYDTKPAVSPTLPVFPPIFSRNGLTAVEISSIVQ
ncbi:MAG TPA: hypothetical protein VJC10_02960 [Patescibacteria group bacterium]|nr:hypothetical protein [Patescibacteria group bacterium]